LESRAFKDLSYRKNDFTTDFDALFEKYAEGNNSRTVSGLNFRQPSRYKPTHRAISVCAAKKSASLYKVTYLTDRKWESIRFTVIKTEGEWKLTQYQTSPGKTREGEEIWRTHRL
jgi:hypothetical protein